VESTAITGEVPPVQDTFMLPVLVAAMAGTGAAAREGDTAASRQAAAAVNNLMRENIFIF
jgi:isopentenyl diphosphate isomerase/L-lactate dehydrogenase-like FMN-dependent dehydrogenase